MKEGRKEGRKEEVGTKDREGVHAAGEQRRGTTQPIYMQAFVHSQKVVTIFSF